MKTTRHWFGVEAGTEVRAVSEITNFGVRTIFVERVDGGLMEGPDGPTKLAGISDTWFDEPVGRLPRNPDAVSWP